MQNQIKTNKKMPAHNERGFTQAGVYARRQLNISAKIKNKR